MNLWKIRDVTKARSEYVKVKPKSKFIKKGEKKKDAFVSLMTFT